jgi:glycosyltransferase involved in cell wall biosynthesis
LGARFLSCVVSYNRLFYLRNTVESWREYFQHGDLLVIDNGSDDPQLYSYLGSLAANGVDVIFNRAPQAQQKVGGLYVAMNLALDHAQRHGYDYVYFVQDDMQFMWHDPDFPAAVERIFARCNDAFQVLTTFSKRVTAFAYKNGKRYEPRAALSVYRSKDYGVCDIGVVSMARVHDADFRFGASEGETAARMFDRGYRLYLLHPPHLAWIPWPGTRRVATAGPDTCNMMRPPVARYYYRPLTAEQVVSLKALSLDNRAHHEDFCFPWGWRCLSPYWYSDDWRTYFDCYRRALLSGDLIAPRGGFAALAQLARQGYCAAHALPRRAWRKLGVLTARLRGA